MGPIRRRRPHTCITKTKHYTQRYNRGKDGVTLVLAALLLVVEVVGAALVILVVVVVVVEVGTMVTVVHTNPAVSSFYKLLYTGGEGRDKSDTNPLVTSGYPSNV